MSVVVLKINDAFSLRRVRCHADDGGIDFGARPRNAWRQDPQNLAIAQTLHPDGRGALILQLALRRFAGRVPFEW